MKDLCITDVSPELRAKVLKMQQAQPLERKIEMSLQRIREWYEHWDGQVYVSFSGGKDSTVLLHLVRSIYPDVPAVFVDTGLEYPEIRQFVKTVENVEWLRPKMPFHKVIEKYGYPVISKEQSKYLHELRRTKSEALRQKRLKGKVLDNGFIQGAISNRWQYLAHARFKISHKCCEVMKKRPVKKYEKGSGKHPYLGLMADEGWQRRKGLLEHGCNAYEVKRPQSRPMMFWTEQDVWDYVRRFDVKYSSIYDMGATRTGCMFCMFGVHLEGDPNRFQRMELTHPKQWSYCMNQLGLKEVLEYIGVPWKNPAQETMFTEGERSNGVHTGHYNYSRPPDSSGQNDAE